MSLTLYWLRSQRDRVALYQEYADSWYERFAGAARRAGMDFKVVTPDDLALYVSGSGRGQAFYRGELLSRQFSVFATKLMSWPAYMPDAARAATLIAALGASGYTTTVSPQLSMINNDKLLTVIQPGLSELPRLPTVRIMTRQFGALPTHLEGGALTFPVAVKPSSWGGGFGILRVNSTEELTQALQLAGAAELTVIVQPWIKGTVDHRIYCVDGEPYTAITREPQERELVGNHMQRGRTARIPVPDFLVAPSRQVASTLGVPYVCVDFLVSANQFWLSEIEIDGGFLAGPNFDDVVDARFASYRRRHEELRDVKQEEMEAFEPMSARLIGSPTGSRSIIPGTGLEMP